MASPTSPESPRRLFLALWPGHNERQQLAQLAAQAAGRHRRTPDDQLHLTLVFLGATGTAQQADYESALADVSVPNMELVLDRYGYWPPSRILWLGANRSPPELAQLVKTLHNRLRPCGFSPEARPFQAHVTLARRFRGPVPTEPPAVPLCWRVDDLVLVESLQPKQALRYRVLRRWPPGRRGL